MKKLCLLTSALAMLSFAAPAAADDDNMGNMSHSAAFSGPYLGLYGGYDWSSLDTNVAGLDSEPHGWDGGIFVGYRLDTLLEKMHGVGLGANASIEAFYGLSNSDDSVGGIAVEKKNEWGVSFRPGLSILDKITSPMGLAPYGILGYRNTKYDASSGAIAGSERYNGFELGIGTELLAYGAAGLRLEYAHVWYGSKNGIDPDDDNLRLGVSYHF